MGSRVKSLVIYGILGIAATGINIGLYMVLYQCVRLENIPSNIIAWIVAVLFAFITNKLWVFKSKDISSKVLLPEFLKFYGCRFSTGLLDLMIMLIAVDMLNRSALLYKVISNTIVIILNYVASKIYIFK